MEASSNRYEFGRRVDGSPVEAVELIAAGIKARVLTLGAIVQSLEVPDRNGSFDDIVLGHRSVEEYESQRQYFGATVGRYANRIAGGMFVLDGRKYLLDRNEGPNHLHGGFAGCDLANWRIVDSSAASARLRWTSPDGEGGYPGNLTVDASFTLARGTLLIEYSATCDRTTLVGITHHGYFNLCGESSGRDVLEHRLMLNADEFTPIDSAFIPTGELRRVAGGPFDFREAKEVGRDLRSDDAQLRNGLGFDHNFVLRPGIPWREAARLYEPSSGRTLVLSTDAPGLQFYSGNFLDGTSEGKRGRPYGKHAGLCLEPQVFPNAPNFAHFPSARLGPDEQYRRRIEFSFRCE